MHFTAVQERTLLLNSRCTIACTSKRWYLSKRSACEQPALLLSRVMAVCHPEGAYTLHGYHMVARALALRPKRVLQIMILPSNSTMFIIKCKHSTSYVPKL